MNKNKHAGSTFQSFLEEQGIAEEVEALAIKKLIAYQIEEEMRKKKITKVMLAKRMKTSRASIDRLLNREKFPSVSINTISKAARSIGKHVKLELV